MPDGNGCDVMRVARQRQSLVGIALSGFGMEEAVRRSMDLIRAPPNQTNRFSRAGEICRHNGRANQSNPVLSPAFGQIRSDFGLTKLPPFLSYWQVHLPYRAEPGLA